MLATDVVGKTETPYGVIPENDFTADMRLTFLMDDIQWLLNCGMAETALEMLGTPEYAKRIASLSDAIREAEVSELGKPENFEPYEGLDEDGNYPEEVVE